MRSGIRAHCIALSLILTLVSVEAGADPSTDPKRRAAGLFVQGVRQFSEAKFETAARTFLAADELVPSSRALTNAITAARRASHHLLAAHAAQRALERKDLDAETAALAREALADAMRNLSRVEVDCAPAPCEITLDGEPVAPGVRYTLPGTHDFFARSPQGGHATERLSTLAGASYRVRLQLAPRESSNGVTSKAAVPSVSDASTTSALAAPDEERAARATKPLPPAVFWAGVAGTAVLAGLTTWSGLEAMAARRNGNEPEVQRLARRTDYFLAGAVIAGGATAVAGIWLVEWGSGTRTALSPLPGGGLAVATEGRF